MPGFRPGRLGLSVRPPLENGAAWRFPRSLGLGEFLTQLFDRRRKTRNLILLSADQGDQLPVLTGREVFIDAHSQSIKT